MPPIGRGRRFRLARHIMQFKKLLRWKSKKRKTKHGYATLLTSYTKAVADLSREKGKIAYLESMLENQIPPHSLRALGPKIPMIHACQHFRAQITQCTIAAGILKEKARRLDTEMKVKAEYSAKQESKIQANPQAGAPIKWTDVRGDVHLLNGLFKDRSAGELKRWYDYVGEWLNLEKEDAGEEEEYEAKTGKERTDRAVALLSKNHLVKE